MLFVFEIFILTMYVVFIDYGDELLPVDPVQDHDHDNDLIRLSGKLLPSHSPNMLEDSSPFIISTAKIMT